MTSAGNILTATFCLSYSDFCAESTTLVHNCTSAGVCSNEVCTGQVATQEAVGTCQRNTDGAVCLVGNGPEQEARVALRGEL